MAHTQRDAHPKWFTDLPEYDKTKPKCFGTEYSIGCIKVDCPVFGKCKAIEVKI